MGDRNSCPAEIIQREVLAKERRALVIYGGMHLLRKNLYWQAKNQELVNHQFNPLPYVGYCFGIRSERRLCEEVHLNLA